MKKVVFFDVDGTLFDNDRLCVSSNVIKALNELSKNEDVIMALATGRTYRSIDVIKEIKDLFRLKILLNGQIIMLDDQIIYDQPMDQKTLEEMLSYTMNKNIPLGFVGLEKEVVTASNDFVLSCFDRYMIPYPKIDLDFHRKEKVYQSWIFASDEDIDIVEQKFPNFIYFRWGDNNGADIISGNSSKAMGIKRAIELLNINRENVIAIGDGNNDYEMIEYANIGIAMGNGSKKTKEVADYIAKDIKEDGVIDALKFLQMI